jgi:hypothetical protein
MIRKMQCIFQQNKRPSAIVMVAMGSRQMASIHGTDKTAKKRFV